MPQPYQLVAPLPGIMQTVLRVETGEYIPFDGGNRDYQTFLEWYNAGNDPDPAPEPYALPRRKEPPGE